MWQRCLRAYPFGGPVSHRGSPERRGSLPRASALRSIGVSMKPGGTALTVMPAGPYSCPGAPLARAEARVCIERLLDRTTEIRIAEDKHGPAEDRHYQYVPTFILRVPTELHLEFTL
jgi:cytochrome P450